MNRPHCLLTFAATALLLVALPGCRPPGRPEPIHISTTPQTTAAQLFDDLAVVLSTVVNPHGHLDPTALAAQLPRLDRQLAALAQPWPQEVLADPLSDLRLAWLYNARAAWALRIAARELTRTPGRPEFQLPHDITASRLLDSTFTLDGRTASLRHIDAQLAQFDDFRIPLAAPDVTDLHGPLPQTPFQPDTVRSQIPLRFNLYARDPRRILIDHASRRLLLPPPLYARADHLRHQYNRRYRTRDAHLVTALTPYLDSRARARLQHALGYSTAPKTANPRFIFSNPIR